MEVSTYGRRILTNNILEFGIASWAQDTHFSSYRNLSSIPDCEVRKLIYLENSGNTNGKNSIISGSNLECVGASALACSTIGQTFSMSSVGEKSFASSDGRIKQPVCGLPAPNTMADWLHEN